MREILFIAGHWDFEYAAIIIKCNGSSVIEARNAPMKAMIALRLNQWRKIYNGAAPRSNITGKSKNGGSEIKLINSKSM